MAATELNKLLQLMADVVQQANVELDTQTDLLATLFESYAHDLKRLCPLKKQEADALQDLVLRFQTLAKPGAFNKNDANSIQCWWNYLCV